MEAEKPKQREPRYKIIIVPRRLILEMVEGLYKYESIKLPKFKLLPKGYEVVEVHHDYRYDAFAFKLYHKSFDPVLPGMETPRIDYGVTYEVFYLKELRKKRDGTD